MHRSQNVEYKNLQNEQTYDTAYSSEPASIRCCFMSVLHTKSVFCPVLISQLQDYYRGQFRVKPSKQFVADAHAEPINNSF